MRRPHLGMLFALACVPILAITALASATPKVKTPVQMTQLADRYQRIYENVDKENAGPYKGGVAGRNVADDGIFVKGAPARPPTRDELKHGIAVMDRMLHPPAPEPVASSTYSSGVAPAPVETSYAPPPTSSGGCPSYMAAEATSPDAVNPTSGAAGCYQILPSTQAAHGCADVGPECAAVICATEGPGAWAASGANPCPYVQP